MIIERIETYPVHIAYPQAVQWASQTEDGADYLIVKITTKDGLIGVAEGTSKVPWSGTTLHSLATAIADVFAPLLIGVDVADAAQTARIIDPIPDNRLAKAMLDIACWDLRAQTDGRPLWQMWGGERTVPVSYAVTRKSPLDMAREVASCIETHGFRVLKIKTGQGMDVDRQTLREARSAAGEDVRIYADCNGAYARSEVPAVIAMLQDEGVFLAEDPCHFVPDESFVTLRESSALPLLVDRPANDLVSIRPLLERGAEAISIKLAKCGLTNARGIVDVARAAGAKAHVGFHGETSLGAAAALQLAAGMSDDNAWLPAETTFFLTLPQEFVRVPLVVKDGAVVLDEKPGFGATIDWGRVASLRP
jgi:L-Ala-D/L-Glu epimerase